MKTIGEQINIFLAESGLKATELSKASGVHDVCICRLRSGKQKDTYSGRADVVRSAMRRLDPAAAAKALAD